MSEPTIDSLSYDLDTANDRIKELESEVGSLKDDCDAWEKKVTKLRDVLDTINYSANWVLRETR
jgi:predicted nuclease with TOPRIM domain